VRSEWAAVRRCSGAGPEWNRSFRVFSQSRPARGVAATSQFGSGDTVISLGSGLHPVLVHHRADVDFIDAFEGRPLVGPMPDRRHGSRTKINPDVGGDGKMWATVQADRRRYSRDDQAQPGRTIMQECNIRTVDGFTMDAQLSSLCVAWAGCIDHPVPMVPPGDTPPTPPPLFA